MRNQIRTEWIKRWALTGVISAAILASFTACASEAERTSETNEFVPASSASSPGDSAPSDAASSSQIEVKQLASGLAFDWDSKIDVKGLPLIKEQLEHNQQLIAEAQANKAKELGLSTDGNRTFYGHLIYTKAGEPGRTWIFSGMELVETDSGLNLFASDNGLYGAETFFDVVGRGPGSIKTEDGVLIGSDGLDWVDTPTPDVSIEMVLVDGVPIDKISANSNLSDYGIGSELRLAALTGFETLESVQKAFAEGKGRTVLVNGTRYQILAEAGNLEFGYDNQMKVVILNRKMASVLDNTGNVDPDATAKLFANALDREGLTYPSIKIGDKVNLITLGADGNATETSVPVIELDGSFTLWVNVEGMARTLGLKTLWSEDGSVVNLITDTEYNVTIGDNEFGYTVNSPKLKSRADVVEAAERYTFIVTQEQTAAEQAAAQAAAVKAQQDAVAAQQKKEEAAASSSAASGGGAAGSTPDKPLVENSNPQQPASSKAESSEANVKPGKPAPGTPNPNGNGMVVSSNGQYYVQPGGPFAEPSAKVLESSGTNSQTGVKWFTKSSWMSDIGAWRGTDLGGNDVLLFPGGNSIPWKDYTAIHAVK